VGKTQDPPPPKAYVIKSGVDVGEGKIRGLGETGEGIAGGQKGVLRIVAGVVFKAVYSKAFHPKAKEPHRLRVETILGLRKEYQRFGCSNAEQVDKLANEVSFSLLKFYPPCEI